MEIDLTRVIGYRRRGQSKTAPRGSPRTRSAMTLRLPSDVPPAILDQQSATMLGWRGVPLCDELPSLRPISLGLGRQRNPARRPTPAATSVAIRSARVVDRSDQTGQRQRAPQEQVRVMLPREADAADDLDRRLGVAHGGIERDIGTSRRPKLRLRAPTPLHARYVPSAGHGELTHDEHVRQVMLDRLEAAG